MKKFINIFVQFALFLTLAFGAGAVAHASSFVSEPWSDGKGVTTVGSSSSSAADTNSLNLPGNNTFYAFIAYQNRENYDLTNVKAQFDFATSGTSSTVTIQGMLGASNGTTETDYATVTGMPTSGWDLNIVSASVYNDHGSNYAACTPASDYNYNQSLSSSAISNNWVNLPGGAAVLDTFQTSSVNGYTGACDQGHVVVGFKVTVTQSSTTPTIQTNNESSVGSNSAQLNGEVVSGSTSNAFFVYGTSNALTCSGSNTTNGGTVPAFGNYSAGDVFSVNQGGLMQNTMYYYRACAQDGTAVISGNVESFITTGGTTTNNTDPDATTYNADDVDDDSAELNGNVDMNSFQNGIVFFVWGQNQNDVENVENEDSYSDINENGDDLQKEEVDDDLDGSDNYNLDINGLDTNEDYYFRICVEYNDNGSTLECGNVKNFETTDNNSNPGGSGDSEIVTKNPDSVGTTFAKICGDLQDDGGDNNLRTWMEYRRSTSSSWTQTNKYDRGEVYYCDSIYGLTEDTKYIYRACSDDECDSTREFITSKSMDATGKPLVTTENATNIGANSAVLNGFFVSNADDVQVWFNYGRTQSLGSQTVKYTKNGSYGAYVHNFTGLASNTYYYYQAVAQNDEGIAYGSILRFKTGGNGVVEVIEQIGEPIDLASLGLGLSLVRLEIDDDRTQVVRGENIEYVVSWENISTLDLTDIDLKVTLPMEIQITNTSRGIFDKDQNAIFYTIDDLDDGEDGELTVFGTVISGSLGDALTAEATLAFDNPVNEAKENATDYDVDEFVINTNFGTASVFGLSNISFLGWLVILLGLLVIFLVARWLYLEREELRAQAYANGYGRPTPMPIQPQYNNYPQSAPQGNVAPDYYQAPAQSHMPPQQAAPTYEAPVQNNNPDAGYKPYRPNR